MELQQIVRYTNTLLKVAEIKDYPNALNGLQLENPGPVRRIAAAVDACEPVIEMAVERRADLLVVHHGLFWGGAQQIDGALYRKLKLAMDHDLAIYSAHLPLDAHPTLGNNALLCKALGLGRTQPFLEIGLKARAAVPIESLIKRVRDAVGDPVHAAKGGPKTARVIGVVTGGAGAEVARAAAEGVDTFITGEGPHWSYTAAEELGINLIYGGHYATETFGVKALAEHLAAKFKLSWQFLDHPTGL
jgi:dinuclear metal center YbgI/SA1388 family protein